jgi:hypothetical protein
MFFDKKFLKVKRNVDVVSVHEPIWTKLGTAGVHYALTQFPTDYRNSSGLLLPFGMHPSPQTAIPPAAATKNTEWVGILPSNTALCEPW